MSLSREAAVLGYLGAFNQPAPKLYGFWNFEGLSLLVMEYLRHNGQTPPAAAVGAILHALHALPVDHDLKRRLGNGDFDCFKGWVVAKVIDRLRKMVALMRADLPETIHKIMACMDCRCFGDYAPNKLSMLHMDIRSPNIISVDSAEHATPGIRIVDWSNCLLGDPWLELFRTEEYLDLNTADVLNGYGRLPTAPPRSVELIYRLYTTTMLSLLFHRMVPDPVRKRMSIERTCMYSEELLAVRI